MSSVDITNFSEEMKQNARRTAEINRYYELKYAQYKKIAFEFAVGLVIIIAIIILGNFLPDSVYMYSKYIVIIVAVFILVRLGTQIFDLTRRSPVIFDEYEFKYPGKYQDYEFSLNTSDSNDNTININTATIEGPQANTYDIS